jgi:GNAT superfamily N-acetyltransferase
MTIIMSQGLQEHMRLDAARIYFEAFRQKLTPLLGAPTTAVPLLARNLDLSSALGATRDASLLGLAGFHHAGRALVNWRCSAALAELGLLRAIKSYAIALLFTRYPRADELLLDGIAVDAAARGKGVGSQLMAATVDFARAHGYRAIRLDVVDTNPDARRLYERLGFVAVAAARYPFMRPFGFTGVTSMRKAL